MSSESRPAFVKASPIARANPAHATTCIRDIDSVVASRSNAATYEAVRSAPPSPKRSSTRSRGEERPPTGVRGATGVELGGGQMSDHFVRTRALGALGALVL